MNILLFMCLMRKNYKLFNIIKCQQLKLNTLFLVQLGHKKIRLSSSVLLNPILVGYKYNHQSK